MEVKKRLAVSDAIESNKYFKRCNASAENFPILRERALLTTYASLRGYDGKTDDLVKTLQEVASSN